MFTDTINDLFNQAKNITMDEIRRELKACRFLLKRSSFFPEMTQHYRNKPGGSVISQWVCFYMSLILQVINAVYLSPCHSSSLDWIYMLLECRIKSVNATTLFRHETHTHSCVRIIPHRSDTNNFWPWLWTLKPWHWYCLHSQRLLLSMSLLQV